MRKLLACVALLLVCALLPLTAGADSLYEWNRSCRRKTICTTKVYSGGDTNRVIAVLPPNTYVKPGFGTDEWLPITYRTASGKSGSGLAKPECIGSAVIFFTDANGDRRGIQELQYYEMYGNNPVPGATMDEPYPGYPDYREIDPNGGSSSTTESGNNQESLGKNESAGKPGSNGTSSTTSSSNKNKPSSKSASTQKPETVQMPVPDILWQGEKVTVRTLGVVSSVILVDGKEQTVPTEALTFSEKVAEDKRFASILAPRTGRCYLRAKASSKGTVIDKCQAGTVVQVIKYGKSYCQIVYEGQVGYVQTACLTFLDPAAEILGTTVLTYNGRATGAAQVPIRNEKSNDSASVAKLRSGTEVVVLAREGSWYEVACQGLHGYVHKNYMSAEIE